jgi:glycosyltransferase involved in cell wall biosynthesis
MKNIGHIAKSCLAVWVDDQSGFGTFPIEAMECNTPIIGKIPNLIPEWMEAKDEQGNLIIKNNGVWTNTTLNLAELVATYMKLWFEDSVPTELMNGIKESQGQYTETKQKETLENVYTKLFEDRKQELTLILSRMENQLTSLNEQTNN